MGSRIMEQLEEASRGRGEEKGFGDRRGIVVRYVLRFQKGKQGMEVVEL